MGTATEAELSGFNRLLDAVLKNPEAVPEMVRQEPHLLECVDQSAETVLHWLAVENEAGKIELLHRLGASIPEFAVVHALQAGHVETVDLLLRLRGTFGPVDPLHILQNPVWGLTPEKKAALLACLKSHGYAT